jgi:hypothetical protein
MSPKHVAKTQLTFYQRENSDTVQLHFPNIISRTGLATLP